MILQRLIKKFLYNRLYSQGYFYNNKKLCLGVNLNNLKHYKKKLSLDDEAALDRTKQQGKRKDLAKKKTPPEIKKKKGFIDTLIIKELDDDIKEDTIFSKDDKDNEITRKVKEINPLLLKNIRSIKRMAEKMNVPLSELIRALKNE